jgi:leader peptidase (prepilin peptidase)/N-methyltransferase
MFEDLFNVIEMYPLMGYILVFFFSAIIGSFLNVVIYRYPIMIQYEYAEIIRDNANNLSNEVLDVLERGKGMSLSLPSSHCFNCKQKIKWYNNIPLLSYLILGGKCFNCKVSYSARYFFVELSHVFAWLFLFYVFGLSLNFIVYAIAASLLLSMSMIDLDHKILPDGLVFSLYGLGLISSTFDNALVSPNEAILSSIIGFLICHSFISIYSKIRGKLMMGFGDVKLITAILTFIPIINVVYGLLIGSILGILYFVVCKVFNKLDKDQYIAFGPFICLGFFIQIVTLGI